MKYETLSLDTTDGILTITLDRPQVMNAFNTQMANDLIGAFDRGDEDDAVKAIIVTGAGKAFCAGADLSAGAATFDYENVAGRSALASGGDIDWASDAVRDTGGRVSLRIFHCLKPVIGAINGAAVGIGATMLLPMDIRLASSAARFGFVFARRGIVPEAASSWFLPRLVGISRALEWCYSGRVFSADEALAASLLRAVHPPEALLPAARALAHELTNDSAPVSVALTRQMMWRLQAADDPMEAHKIDSRAVYARGRSADAREGVTSFLEKRAAHYSDRVSKDLPSFFPWWSERPWS